MSITLRNESVLRKMNVAGDIKRVQKTFGYSHPCVRDILRPDAPCNSVPSERAFSIQNIIHSKIRNQLSSAKVDKLTYIYMNSRILGLKSSTSVDPSSKAQIKQVPRSPYDLSEKQMAQMEDELLEDEVIREMDGMEEDSDCSEDDDEY